MSLPPIHSTVVHLSIMFVLVSFATDLFAKMFRKPALAKVAFWFLLAATISGGFAIAAGYWDTSRASLSPETNSYLTLHVFAGWILAALLMMLTVWRWRIRQQARRVVTKPYVAGALTVMALTLFETWYGAELVYSHGAGVAAAGQGVQPAAEAQERLARVREALGPIETAVGGVGQKSETERGPQTPER
jgi:uncharacterized membrane protein